MVDVKGLLRILGGKESEVCEFKIHNSQPALLGKNISAKNLKT